MLFGLGTPGHTSLVVGGWSIGVEMVFYSLFPLCMALFGSRLIVPMLVLLAVQASQVSYLVPGGELSTQDWYVFCSQLSFIFYFMAGCWVSIRLAFDYGRLSTLWLVVAMLLFMLMILVGFWADSKPLVTGLPGVGLALLSVAIVYAWGRVSVPGVKLTSITFFLGGVTYGVYLFHPIVYALFKRLIWKPEMHIWFIIASVTIFTLALSLIVHRKFERPVRRMLIERIFALPAAAS